MSLSTPTKFPPQRAHTQPRGGLLSRAEGGRPVALVAGAGLVTPLGRDFDETWDALLAGRYIHDHARAAGEFDPSVPRVVQMARRAAREATTAAAWCEDDVDAIVVGTSKGSVESWIAQTAGGLSPAGLGDIAEALAGNGAIRLTLSGACASGLMALIRGAMLIESGHAGRVLVVAAEASVHPLFIGGFQRLGVLPRQGVGCRPFDLHRDGFLMSEAAAAVCLKACDSSESAKDGGEARVPVRIERYAMGADARHLTGGDPDGAVLRRLIDHVTQGEDVDLVHAHGTGTAANDPIELAAIEAVLGRDDPESGPRVYSHKAALGHSLGAAGLVSVALNARSHATGILPGNVRTTNPLPTRGLSLPTFSTRRPVRRSIALAAGFGGGVAVVGLITGAARPERK